MKVGSTDINEQWLASKTEDEAVEILMRKWGNSDKLHPAFARRNDQQRKDYIRSIHKSLPKNVQGNKPPTGETGPETVKEPKQINKPATK